MIKSILLSEFIKYRNLESKADSTFDCRTKDEISYDWSKLHHKFMQKHMKDLKNFDKKLLPVEHNKNTSFSQQK